MILLWYHLLDAFFCYIFLKYHLMADHWGKKQLLLETRKNYISMSEIEAVVMVWKVKYNEDSNTKRLSHDQ